MGTILEVHVIRIIIYWGLYWGPLILVTSPVPASHYLDGQGDLVSGLIMGISGVSIWLIGLISIHTQSP